MARNKGNEATQASEGGAPGDTPDTPQSVAKDGQGAPLAPLVASHQVIRRGLGRRPRTPQPSKPAEAVERVEPPTARRYRVTKGGTIADTGMPQSLKEGKFITDVQYDIASLERQGIGLELQEEPAEAVEETED